VLRDAPFAVMVVDHRRGGGPDAAFWLGQRSTSEGSNLPQSHGDTEKNKTFYRRFARMTADQEKNQKLTAD
jgi:hypothetical protein